MAELSLPNQARFLQFLDDKKVRAVGATRRHQVDVRIIAATNRDLRAAVEKGDFRQDLLYRLRVVVLQVPPLRRHDGNVSAASRDLGFSRVGLTKKMKRLGIERPR